MKRAITAINKLKIDFNIYATLTLKPHYKQNGNDYLEPLFEVYISGMVQPFSRGLGYLEACSFLEEVHSNPIDALKTRKENRIEYLRESLEDYSEELKQLTGEKL